MTWDDRYCRVQYSSVQVYAEPYLFRSRRTQIVPHSAQSGVRSSPLILPSQAYPSDVVKPPPEGGGFFLRPEAPVPSSVYQPSLRTGVTFARTNTPAKNTTSDSTRFAASVPSTPSMLATANTTAVARAGSLATRSQARAIICCLSFLLASYSPTTCWFSRTTVSDGRAHRRVSRRRCRRTATRSGSPPTRGFRI